MLSGNYAVVNLNTLLRSKSNRSTRSLVSRATTHGAYYFHRERFPGPPEDSDPPGVTVSTDGPDLTSPVSEERGWDRGWEGFTGMRKPSTAQIVPSSDAMACR